MKKGLTLRLLGRSGSGKDTQAELLQKEIKFEVVISMGNLLREIAKKETVAGKRIKEIHDSGSIPETWIANYLWEKELIEHIMTNEENILIDAARRIEEAKYLDEALAWFGRTLIPILIDVPRNVAFNRLMKRKGKLYDNEAAINMRLNWYETLVQQTVDYYKSQNKLIVMNGNQDPKVVHYDIMRALEKSSIA